MGFIDRQMQSYIRDFYNAVSLRNKLILMREMFKMDVIGPNEYREFLKKNGKLLGVIGEE